MFYVASVFLQDQGKENWQPIIHLIIMVLLSAKFTFDIFQFTEKLLECYYAFWILVDLSGNGYWKNCLKKALLVDNSSPRLKG